MAIAKPVVIYDGACPFCIKQIERFKSLDLENQLEYVPRQSPDLLQRFPMLAQANFDSGMRFVGIDGNVDVGADAVYQIGLRLPSLQVLARLYPFPVIKQISQLVYACISANRKRLAQKCGSTCSKD